MRDRRESQKLGQKEPRRGAGKNYVSRHIGGFGKLLLPPWWVGDGDLQSLGIISFYAAFQCEAAMDLQNRNVRKGDIGD